MFGSKGKLARAFVAASLVVASLSATAAHAGQQPVRHRHPARQHRTHRATRVAGPTVAVTSPADGERVTGTVTVRGTAASDSAVRKIRYRVDRGSFQPVDGTTSWSFALHTADFRDGEHSIKVRVFDADGDDLVTGVRLLFDNPGGGGTAPDPTPTPDPTPDPIPAPDPPPPPRPNGRGTIVGIASNENPSAIASVEQALGARFLGVRRNAAMIYPLPLGDDLRDDASGRIVYRNANNEDRNNPINRGWAGVANGNADPYLAAAVPMIRANYTVDEPYLFSFHHEQAASTSTQCGIGCNGDAREYRAAFIHVVRFFRDAGVADRMRFVLTGTLQQYVQDTATTGISAVDPGPEWVDIYGVDAYTRASGGSLTKLHPQLDVVSTYARRQGRPYLVGEWGVASEVATGADYWREAVAQIQRQGMSGPGSCYGIFTDVASLSSTANLRAVRETMVGNPQFRWA
jgi:hypothetical protein